MLPCVSSNFLEVMWKIHNQNLNSTHIYVLGELQSEVVGSPFYSFISPIIAMHWQQWGKKKVVTVTFMCVKKVLL